MPRKQLLYRNMGERITAAEAKRKYMNPRLINRANARMSREALSALILHHAAELRWLMENYYPPFATGDYSGSRVTKKRLVEMANQLHDCWNATNLHKSARAGEPIIWED